MRLKVAAVLMILLCLLTACGSKENEALQAPMDFRAALLQAEACSFHAEITADYGDSVQQFGLQCECRIDGTAQVELTAPETLTGICATVTDSGGTLQFDGMAIAFDLLAGGNVAPIGAPCIVTAAWTNAYISAVGKEGETRRCTYAYGYEERQLMIDCWFDEKNVPIFAEICYNNKTVLKIAITDFSYVSGGIYEATQENVG